jgi:putative phosphonate catabolism associated alcohol dehydrogenase
MQSRAAVFARAGQPLELTGMAVPRLSPGEALVEISACTLCGSDLHTIHGRRGVSGPTVLGHEMIGRVIAFENGETQLQDIKGDRLEVGDRVTWSIVVGCGNCLYCLRGLPQKCRSLFKYGHEPIQRAPFSGGLAEHCLLRPNTRILKIPGSLPDEIACPANCATATVAAAFRSAGEVCGKTVLIHGAGMLGLTAAAFARYSQAKEIVVTDLSDDRLARGLNFGASRIINVNSASRSLAEETRDLTNGLGADVILEMSGSSLAVESSIDLLGIGGKLILVGAVFPTPPAGLPPEQIVRKLLRIEGVHNYVPEDLLTAVAFLECTRERFSWSKLVADRFSLSEVNQAVAVASQSQAVRVLVYNDHVK